MVNMMCRTSYSRDARPKLATLEPRQSQVAETSRAATQSTKQRLSPDHYISFLDNVTIEAGFGGFINDMVSQ